MSPLTGSTAAAFSSRGYCNVMLEHLDEVLDLARSLGTITFDTRHPELYRRIHPQQIETATPNTLSSRYGLGSFPFHTDGAHWRYPPQYLFLYCENPGPGDRPTVLIDTQTWKIDSEFRRSLISDVWKTGHHRPQLCTVGDEFEDALSIRYDSACMEPLGERARELHEKIEQTIVDSASSSVNWSPGKLLIINNHRMLHARGAARECDVTRVLVRILVGGVQ